VFAITGEAREDRATARAVQACAQVAELEQLIVIGSVPSLA